MANLVNKYYDVSKLVIWGDDAGDDSGRRSRMVFSFRDGNPRITVYSGTVGKEGVISFPSDHTTMVTIMNMMKDVAKGEPGNKFSATSQSFIYENDKPTTNKRVVATLHIGKSKEGIVYLSVIMEGRPKLVFSMKPSPFHSFFDKDKNPIPDSAISTKMALGLADLVLTIVGNIIVSYTNEEYETGVRKPALVKTNNANNPAPNQAVIQELDDLAL